MYAKNQVAHHMVRARNSWLVTSIVQGKWPKCERLQHQSKLEWIFLKPKERPHWSVGQGRARFQGGKAVVLVMTILGQSIVVRCCCKEMHAQGNCQSKNNETMIQSRQKAWWCRNTEEWKSARLAWSLFTRWKRWIRFGFALLVLRFSTLCTTLP